ncbi:hypothetical protein ACOSQ3_028019 [Xanthoceras sorbifolium]
MRKELRSFHTFKKKRKKKHRDPTTEGQKSQKIPLPHLLQKGIWALHVSIWAHSRGVLHRESNSPDVRVESDRHYLSPPSPTPPPPSAVAFDGLSQPDPTKPLCGIF